MPHTLRSYFFLFLLILSGVISINADTVTFREGLNGITTHGGTYIRSDSPDSARYVEDTDKQLKIGQLSGTSKYMRGLLEFDLNSVSNFASINSVSLILTTANGNGITENVDNIVAFSVHAYDYNFDEASSTWNNPVGDVDVSDATAGGTFNSAEILASKDVKVAGSDAQNVAHTFVSTMLFQQAVESALNGDGFLRLLIKGTSEVEGGYHPHNFGRFHDQRVVDELYRPTLMIDYNTIPELNNIAFIFGFILLHFTLCVRRNKVLTQM